MASTGVRASAGRAAPVPADRWRHRSQAGCTRSTPMASTGVRASAGRAAPVPADRWRHRSQAGRVRFGGRSVDDILPASAQLLTRVARRSLRRAPQVRVRFGGRSVDDILPASAQLLTRVARRSLRRAPHTAGSAARVRVSDRPAGRPTRISRPAFRAGTGNNTRPGPRPGSGYLIGRLVVLRESAARPSAPAPATNPGSVVTDNSGRERLPRRGPSRTRTAKLGSPGLKIRAVS